MTFVARLYRCLDVHRWAISASNILAAALFVAGCIGFFWPDLHVMSVTLFLAGSLLFLFSALAGALLDHGQHHVSVIRSNAKLGHRQFPMTIHSVPRAATELPVSSGGGRPWQCDVCVSERAFQEPQFGRHDRTSSIAIR